MFLKHFVDEHGRNEVVPDFRQRWALEAALDGLLDWNIGLQIIRQTYGQGASFNIGPMVDRPVHLPSDIGGAILDEPDKYPTALWNFSEAVAAGNARKGVRPVGVVAKSDKWFST
jgi:hypothetical protein